MKFFAALMLICFSAFAGTEIKLNSGLISTRDYQHNLNQASAAQTEWIIQFKDHVTEATKNELRANGIKVYSYLPEDALLVRADKEIIEKYGGRSSVQAILAFNGTMKLSPTLGAVSSVTAEQRQTFIVSTFGYTFLYLGFGIITGITIALSLNIRQKILNKWLKIPYEFMIWVGVHSYGIYLCHAIVGAGVVSWIKKVGLTNFPGPVYLIFYLASTILVGVLLTRLIESPFLKIREKYFPNSKKISITITN